MSSLGLFRVGSYPRVIRLAIMVAIAIEITCLIFPGSLWAQSGSFGNSPGQPAGGVQPRAPFPTGGSAPVRPAQFRPNPTVPGGQAGVGVAQVPARQFAAAQDLSAAFRQVAESMRPSVVSITTRKVRPGAADPFDRRRGRQRESTGEGSGVIVDVAGYILTNNHVVEGADELTVELEDGQTFPGKIIGTDPQTDLAVLKIESPGLRAAPFGNSDAIQVGDWVLAIGSPFGLDQTVTAGIISGKNRVQRIINDGDGFEDFLQTDAAINPGNSGGPLVNLRGELVGINTAILSRSGASAGIGFAIPVSLALPVLKSIIENGEVRRGFLGASVVDVTPRSVRQYDLKVTQGGLIASVLDRQPAAVAGLRPGDVVTEVDGKQIRGGPQLRNYVASRPPGSVVRMRVNRAGGVSVIPVTLRERTDEAMAMFLRGRPNPFGAQMVPLTRQIAQRIGWDGPPGGLLVIGIRDGSEAEAADLKVGDVIETVANIAVNTVEEFDEIIAEANRLGRKPPLTIRRGRQQLMLVPIE